MPGRKYQAGSGSYRYGFQTQEKSTEINDNLYNAKFWEYDSRIVRRWNVDPLARKFPWQTPYSALDDDPINKTDPLGMAAAKTNSPIYGTDGKFLGTDDEGLKGKAIIMKKEDFTQGMKHGDAAKKDLAPKGGTQYFKAIPNYTNYLDFYNHYTELPKRPDYDGYLTKAEADTWWIGKSGQSLYVDQSKIGLPGISTKTFANKAGSSLYNNFVWGLSNTGQVYGTLKLTLQNASTGTVHIGGEKYVDEYDYKMDNRLFRNVATWIGRPGGANNGKEFFIIGYGQATVPVKK